MNTVRIYYLKLIKNLVFWSVLVILLNILIGDDFFILPKSEASSSIARQYGGHVVAP